MSVILKFPISKPDANLLRVSNQSAEVIIFPGVRIERGNFNTTKKITRVRKQRQIQPKKKKV